MIAPCVPEMEMTATELMNNVEMAFDRIDTNKDGVLTREEFVASCLRVSKTSVFWNETIVIF